MERSVRGKATSDSRSNKRVPMLGALTSKRTISYIPSDVVSVAQSILNMGLRAVTRSGSEGLYRLLENRKLRIVRHTWKRIQAPEAGRGKLVRIEDMLRAAADQ